MNIERTKRIALLYQQGRTYEQIRSVARCSNRYIIDSLKKHGVKRRGSKHAKDKNEDTNKSMATDIESGICISDMKKKYRISFYTAKRIINIYRQTGKIQFGRNDGTKYHNTIKGNEINFDETPTCIYLNGRNGNVLQCGRQVL